VDQYAYIEASTATQGQKAQLVSVATNPVATARCMSFYYHMYGATVKTLKVMMRQGEYIKLSKYTSGVNKVKLVSFWGNNPDTQINMCIMYIMSKL
jgi:hypothetical protein